jgi:hypothetical protein
MKKLIPKTSDHNDIVRLTKLLKNFEEVSKFFQKENSDIINLHSVHALLEIPVSPLICDITVILFIIRILEMLLSRFKEKRRIP